MAPRKRDDNWVDVGVFLLPLFFRYLRWLLYHSRAYEVSLLSSLLLAIYAPPSFLISMTLPCQMVVRLAYSNCQFLDYALVAEALLQFSLLSPVSSTRLTQSKMPVPTIPMLDLRTSPEARLPGPVVWWFPRLLLQLLRGHCAIWVLSAFRSELMPVGYALPLLLLAQVLLRHLEIYSKLWYFSGIPVHQSTMEPIGLSNSSSAARSEHILHFWLLPWLKGVTGI